MNLFEKLSFKKKSLSNFTIKLFLSIGMLVICLSSYGQRVTPFQSGSYVPLLTSLRDFSPAPAGMYLINYNYWVTPQAFYDKNGDKLSGVNLDLPEEIPGIGDNIIDLYPEAKAYMGNFSLYYSSPLIKELGNARYSFILGPTFQKMRYKVDARIGDEEIHKKGGIAGYGDVFLQPFGLSWSFEDRFDFSFFYGLYLPTASYQTGAEDNLGVGHISHQIQAPFLAYLNEQSTAFLVVPTFETSGWFVDRDVKPGNRFSIEYGISQYITEWLELEVMNAHNWQIGADKGEDAWWLDTSIDVFDKKNLVSVGVNAWSWAGRMQMRFKYIWEYGAKQNVTNNYFSASIFFNPRWLNAVKNLK